MLITDAKENGNWNVSCYMGHCYDAVLQETWDQNITTWQIKRSPGEKNYTVASASLFAQEEIRRGAWNRIDGQAAYRTAVLNINGSVAVSSDTYMINVERDALGRVTQKTETLEGNKTRQTYTYDLGGRLTEVKSGENGETTETWGYDPNGNRTHRNGTLIATFDAQDRLLSQNGITYDHNLMGQRTKKQGPGGTTTYRYDNLGNLREANVNGAAITYAIDPQDRRIGRKQNGTWTHKWIYQDGLNPIAELDDQDRIRKAFIYADKGHVPAYMLTFDAAGNETGQYRIVSDLLGSVRAVYDLTTGNLIQQIDYDVWGNITNDTNPDFQPFAFAGGLYDQQTKLTRFGARDYDPETGRWTAKDPIDFAGGDSNLYGYVLNNPINGIDPTGTTLFSFQLTIGGGVGRAIVGASTYALRVHEPISAKTCWYTVSCFGIGVGLPEFGLLSAHSMWDDGQECSTCEKFEGWGSQGYASFIVGIGVSAKGWLNVPNGPRLSGDSWVNFDGGAFRVGTGISMCRFSLGAPF